MTPRADERELGVFDSKNELILDVRMKGGQIERMKAIPGSLASRCLCDVAR
jgi:hypothetical protein